MVSLYSHSTYFTDCVAGTPEQGAQEQENAVARMEAAVAHYLGGGCRFVPVPYASHPGYETAVRTPAMTLVDVLEPARPVSRLAAACQSLVLGNSSPRAASYGQHPNGCRIGWFKTGEPGTSGTIGVMTRVPELLALTQRLGIITGMNMIDPDDFLPWAVTNQLLDQVEAQHLARSQFRGEGLIPLIAKAVWFYPKTVPSVWEELPESAPASGRVLRIDAPFGNVFVDALPAEVGFQAGREIELRHGVRVPCYDMLARVPAGQLACVISDDGYCGDRFLMLAIQGGDAAECLDLSVGDQAISPAELESKPATLAGTAAR